MKADLRGEAEAGSKARAVADPFAVDLFAASQKRGPAGTTDAPVEGSQARVETIEAGAHPEPSVGAAAHALSSWSAALPRISRREAEFSAMLSALPPAFSARSIGACARVLARLARVAPEDVAFETVSLREVSLGDWAASRAEDTAPRVYVLVAIEPETALVAGEAEAGFASALTGLMLGDGGGAPDALRSPSQIERAIIEFLSLSLIHELNREARTPLFRLAALTTETPASLGGRPHIAASSGPAQAHEKAPSQPAHASPVEVTGARALISTLRVSVSPQVGLVRIIFDAKTLAALEARSNPLLSNWRGTDDEDNQRVARLKRLAADVALHLLVGETGVDVAGLAELECGDVVLVERPYVAWREGRIDGEVTVRAGAGMSVLIEGNVVSAASAQGTEDQRGTAGDLRLAMRRVSAKEAGRADAERIGMAEDDAVNFEPGAEEASVLDALLLTVRVELAARRITLDELSRLRAGQILELGCRATDPVELVADGRRIASGELVDVEGQLGVRVTRLLN